MNLNILLILSSSLKSHIRIAIDYIPLIYSLSIVLDSYDDIVDVDWMRRSDVVIARVKYYYSSRNSSLGALVEFNLNRSKIKCSRFRRIVY